MDSTNRALSFLGAATVYAQILGAIFFKNETSNDKYIFKS